MKFVYSVVGDLGSLYDSVTEQITYGHFAYSNHTFPRHTIDRTAIGHIKAKGGVVHNYFEKNEATGISSSVALSIYAGLVNPSGSTRVHKEFNMKKDRIYAVLSYNFRSFMETLNVRDRAIIDRFDTDSMEFYKSTHVVTGMFWNIISGSFRYITLKSIIDASSTCQLKHFYYFQGIEWGATVHCGYEIESFGMTDKTQFEAELNIELGTAAQRLETRNHYSMVNSSFLHGVKMNIELFSDIELGTVSVTSMKEMWDLVVTVPNLTKSTFTGKGSQMYYILTEVEDLYHFANLTPPEKFAVLPDWEFESQLTLFAREAFLDNKQVAVLHSGIDEAVLKYPLLEPKTSKNISIMRTKHDAFYQDRFLPALKNLTYQARSDPMSNHSALLANMSSWYEKADHGGQRTLHFMQINSVKMNAKIEHFRVLLANGVHYLKPSQSLSVLSLEHQGDLYVLLVPEKNESSVEVSGDPYADCRDHLLFLTKVKGTRFVADCSVRTLNFCEGLENPKVFYYSKGFLLSDDFVPFTVNKTEQGSRKLIAA